MKKPKTTLPKRPTVRERREAAYQAKKAKDNATPTNKSGNRAGMSDTFIPHTIEWRPIESGYARALTDEQCVFMTGPWAHNFYTGPFSSKKGTHYILVSDLLKLPGLSASSTDPAPPDQPIDHNTLGATIQNAVTQAILDAHRRIESKTPRYPRFHPTPIPGFPFPW